MKFTVGPALPTDSRGQPYVTLFYTGVKEEGASTPEGHATREEAWRAYWEAFSQYLADATEVEWRVPPMMEEHGGHYRVYSRLSVR